MFYQSINQSVMCKLNSKNAYYKASTKKHKYENSTNTQTLNKQTGNQKNAIFQEEICYLDTYLLRYLFS
jgi:hypothetical protein